MARVPAEQWTVEVLNATVEGELDAWSVELRARLTRIIDRIEAVGLPAVGPPLVEHLDDAIWEMRPSGNRVEGRALYVAVRERRVVILLAFVKKKQKTPRRFIDLAKQRMLEIDK